MQFKPGKLYTNKKGQNISLITSLKREYIQSFRIGDFYGHYKPGTVILLYVGIKTIQDIWPDLISYHQFLWQEKIVYLRMLDEQKIKRFRHAT